MKFTKAQVGLYKSGISFVHMAPDQKRRDRAEAEFKAAVRQAGADTTEGDGDCCSDCQTRLRGTQFIVCSLTGACSEHVSVLFIEDEQDVPERNRRALEEARFIPACVDGVGPMTVR
jgi:hypothetical protein